MGATLVAGGGATFRVWAPRATSVYLNRQTDDMLLAKDARGYWTGFVPNAQDGNLYRFWVNGPGSSGFKRDPYSRELARDFPFPNCSSIIRSATAYPWHDAGFVTPDFSKMILYQLHVGTYAIRTPGVSSTFLDVIGKIPYLADLGVNVVQPLPVDEAESDPSMGYDGADLFSPDFPYVVVDEGALASYVTTINGLLTQKGCAPIAARDIRSGAAQLKALVDLCHVYGIAVAFDLVYNHAGGFAVNGVGDDQSLYYFDRVKNAGNNNDSLYFTDQDRGTGGLSFALWNADVRQFLIDNAIYWVEEFHADGFRFDEISSLLSMNRESGWDFCRDLTNSVRFVKPRLLQNAEYWPFEFGDYPRSTQQVLGAVADGGAGFDVVQHDGLRGAVRGAVKSASFGQGAAADFEAIAGQLYPPGLAHGWQAVTCVENHDLVAVGREPRLPVLADSSDTGSWYASSRSRFATGILLTAPGIPQLFMGQEFLEPKQWHWDPKSANLLSWALDKKMSDHVRFTRDLIRLRLDLPALCGDHVNPFHVHDGNRVIAYHRWLDWGGDVVVAATLSDTTWYDYAIGFPYAGEWTEVFNSDVYENWMNPSVAGNGGAVVASGPAMHGFAASAKIVIPANGLVVFVRR